MGCWGEGGRRLLSLVLAFQQGRFGLSPRPACTARASSDLFTDFGVLLNGHLVGRALIAPGGLGTRCAKCTVSAGPIGLSLRRLNLMDGSRMNTLAGPGPVARGEGLNSWRARGPGPGEDLNSWRGRFIKKIN